jgi:arginine/lysine/histidine transporter system substrate-binding protein
MKKLLTSILVVMVVFGLVGCGKKVEISTVDKIKEKGTLVLLTEATFPPFEYAETGEGSVDGIAGVDIDFGKALAHKLGVELKVLDMDFDTLTEGLKSGKGDIISAGMTADPDRAKIVDFSKPYFDNALYVIVKKGSDIKSANDLNGKKVAVQQGTTGNDYIDANKEIKGLLFGGMVEAGLAVKNGNADASVMDMLTAQIIVANNPELVLLETPVAKEETSMAVQKGNDSLLKVVNELLDELKADGTLQKWFDDHYDSLVIE